MACHPSTCFDLIDECCLPLVEEFEGRAPGGEEDHLAILGAPVLDLFEPESFAIEGHRLLEVCDGQRHPPSWVTSPMCVPPEVDEHRAERRKGRTEVLPFRSQPTEMVVSQPP